MASVINVPELSSSRARNFACYCLVRKIFFVCSVTFFVSVVEVVADCVVVIVVVEDDDVVAAAVVVVYSRIC